MPVDAELISSENFNLKFKNYLRDFYIYQFKERGVDFKVKGTNDKSDVNKDVIDGTFYPDAKRLQYVLEQSAGVQWSKGDYVDIKKGKINKKRENKRVECVTVDARKLAANPFFSLYRHCSESALYAGTHFSFTYALLMYFQLGRKVRRADYTPLKPERELQLKDYLKELAVNIESEARRHNPRSWKELSSEDKEKFGLEAIGRFSKDHDGLEEIYEYMLLNRKKIVYGQDGFTLIADTDGFVEKNVLFYVMQQYNVEVDEKQFGNKMHELTRLGIVITKKVGQRLYYGLSNAFIKELLGDNEDLQVRFSNMISFFSQTSVLGEVGSYILDRLPKQNHDAIYYKHNYLKRALNDYNNIDLLYAIKNKCWIAIEYRNASVSDLKYQRFVCYPIEIRESVTDGRQYLIFYHSGFRSVSAIRIEFIDSITIGHMAEEAYFEEDLKRARELISHTWGTAFDNFQKGNVKEAIVPQKVRILMRCEKEEFFILSRVKRESRKCVVSKQINLEEYGSCLELVAEVTNPGEMLQWLRSYTTRILSVEINGEENKDWALEAARTYEWYQGIPEHEVLSGISSNSGKSLLLETDDERLVPVEDMHSLLFHEIFGTAFLKLGEMLWDISRKATVTKEYIKKCKQDYAEFFLAEQFSDLVQWETQDRRLEQADGFLRGFLFRQGTYVSTIFTPSEGVEIGNVRDLLPLTAVELQWLQNVLKHPLAKCFLSEEELALFDRWQPRMDWFDVNDVVLHDQYLGMEEVYSRTDFGMSMKTLMKALEENYLVMIRYQSQYGTESQNICAPAYLEYSKRDNCFRVRVVCENRSVKTFNLERIREISMLEKTFDSSDIREIVEENAKQNECELAVFFDETKNVPDRILTEFSCFKKKCVKWGDQKYRMTLYYDSQDKREILIRLLSYGSLVHIDEDTGEVREELIGRLKNQIELSRAECPSAEQP